MRRPRQLPPDLTLTVRCEIWTQNRNDRVHWATRKDLVRSTRAAAKIDALAARLPKGIGRARITVTPLVGPRSGVLADPGAYWPPVKAAVDGLRDARVLIDDTDVYVSAIELLPAERVRYVQDVGLRITLSPERPE